jgi:hypothetical protein
MKVIISKKNGEFFFGLTDLTAEEKNLLSEDFYSNENEVYFKKHSETIPEIELIAKNYKKNIEKIINQRLRKEKTDWKTALKFIAEELKKTDIKWYVSGSCALALRGIEVEPKDLNLIFENKEDKEKIKNILGKYAIEPIAECKDWILELYGAAYIENCFIDIASGLKDDLNHPDPIDSSPYAIENLEEINWEGYNLKIPPIQLSLNINKKRKRLETVKLIEEYMKNI